MDNIESLFDKAVGEIERMLNSKTVVGEPIEIEGNTLIPLVNVGFGFGVGSGEGTEQEKGSGHGGGTGGGGGVKPVALIVINDDGVHVESIKCRIRIRENCRDRWQGCGGEGRGNQALTR